MRARSRPDLPPVFRGRDAVAEGLLTAAQLRGGLVERVIRGVYRPAWVPLTHELSCRAAALVMPRTAVITGRSAAWVRGVRLGWAADPVEVAVPEADHFGPVDGLVVRRVVGVPVKVQQEHGLPLAHPFRMGFDLAARRPLPTAVGYLDAAAAAGIVDLDLLSTGLDTCHENDVVAVRRACALTDPRAESVPESELRVHLALAGILTEVQFIVRDARGFVARVDLADPRRRLAIEYDGAHHGLGAQLGRDRARHNALTAAGWTVVYVTAESLRRPGDVVATVHRALALAAS